MGNDYYIGIDLGGSFIKGAAISPEGIILSNNKRPTESKAPTPQIIDNIYNVIKELIGMHGGNPLALGMGIPGAIQFEKGVVTRSPHFPNWNHFDIRSAFAQKISVPFFIDNDANCAALGELWQGSGKITSNFCLLTLGTGIGGGIVLDKKLLRGADGMAAEIGHLIVEPEGKPCGCGGRGCLEKYVSAHSAVEQALEQFDSAVAGNLCRAANSMKDKVTSKLLFDLATEGDPFCASLFQTMGKYLGIGFADLVHIFNIERIIIGGGMMAAWDLLIPPAIREMKSRTYQIPAERVKVVPAECGEDAGVLGAVYLAKTGL